MVKSYYIYLLIDPTTDQAFYCGKGTGDRYKSHLGYWSGNGTNNRCENKIRSLRSKGIEPAVKFLFEGIEDENEAYRLEEDYIRENFNSLVNLKIEARPPSAKGRVPWNKGIPITEGASKKQSNTLKEGYKSGRIKIWTNNLSIKERKDFFSKMALSKKDFSSKTKKEVYCDQLDKVFESITSAANELGVRQGDISNVLAGRQKSTKGYTFKYINGNN